MKALCNMPMAFSQLGASAGRGRQLLFAQERQKA